MGAKVELKVFRCLLFRAFALVSAAVAHPVARFIERRPMTGDAGR
jgi:hypothetical protein